MPDDTNVLLLRLIDDGFVNFRSEIRCYLDKVVAFLFRFRDSSSRLGLGGDHDAVRLFSSRQMRTCSENSRSENLAFRALFSQDQLFRRSDHQANRGDAVSD